MSESETVEVINSSVLEEPSGIIKYAPFTNHPYHQVHPSPEFVIEGTVGRPVLETDARFLIDHFQKYGYCNFSLIGASLWVLALWAHINGVAIDVIRIEGLMYHVCHSRNGRLPLSVVSLTLYADDQTPDSAKQTPSRPSVSLIGGSQQVYREFRNYDSRPISAI